MRAWRALYPFGHSEDHRKKDDSESSGLTTLVGIIRGTEAIMTFTVVISGRQSLQDFRPSGAGKILKTSA
jgi:hypothetical protein